MEKFFKLKANGTNVKNRNRCRFDNLLRDGLHHRGQSFHPE